MKKTGCELNLIQKQVNIFKLKANFELNKNSWEILNMDLLKSICLIIIYILIYLNNYVIHIKGK